MPKQVNLRECITPESSLVTLMSLLKPGYAIGYYDPVKKLVSIHPDDIRRVSELKIPEKYLSKICRLYNLNRDPSLERVINSYIPRGNLIERTIEFK